MGNGLPRDRVVLSPPPRLVEACRGISQSGEQLVLCLEQQIYQHNRAAESAQEVSGTLAENCSLSGYLRHSGPCIMGGNI